MNGKASESGFITLQLTSEEINLILKSLTKCVPENDDQDKVFNMIQYLENIMKT